MVFEKSVTIRELPLASSNNYSALFESDGQVRKKTLGSIISQDIDDYLSGISVSFPTSVFNVASSSITPSDPNLVVSLKNQLAGTVFAAPETLNGTPSFRKLSDVDLSETTVAFQDDIPDTSNFVPYTGATQNVHLNAKFLTGVGHYQAYRGSDFTWANATNSSPEAWNQDNMSLIKLGANNNALAFIADGTTNARKFGIQVGHALSAYASATGVLWLQPLHGQTGIGSLSGTGDRMVVADSQGILSTQSLPSDNYLRLGSYTESQGGFNTTADVFSLRNTVAWATSSANRPNNTNSAIVAFTPYKSGTSEYGFFLGARNNRLWLSTLENSTPNNWVEIAKRSEFDNYLPLSGGTMTGDINFTNNNYGITKNGSLRLSFTSNSTTVSGNNTGTNPGIILRPQGSDSTAGQVTIQADGQINTANHGNSSQWKQAYDWGDFRDFGLGTSIVTSASGNSWDLSSSTDTRLQGAADHSIQGLSGTLWGIRIMSSTANYGEAFGLKDGRAFIKSLTPSGQSPWMELWHTGNLTNVSQLNNDAGYITSVPDSFVTKDNISSSALDTTVINFDNAGNGASILYAGSSSTNRPNVSGTAGGLLIRGNHSTVGEYQMYLARGENDALLYRNQSGVWNRAASREWVTSQGYSTTDTVTRLRGLTSGTFVSGDITLLAGSNTSISQSGNNITISSTNTTYSSGTVALLTAGTNTTNRVWRPDYLKQGILSLTYNPENLTFGTGLNYNSTTGVLTSNQDSIFAYSPQGGLYTTDWSSTALGQHSVAIGYTSVVTASSSTSIGKGVFTGGAMSQNVGFSSNVNKALSANFGSYNLNNGELGNTFGQGLINQGMGLTVVGKYNQVVHHQPDMDVDSKTAAIQFGVGKDELTRRNAVTIFNDRRMDYDAQRDDSAWHQYTIPDIKWIQENISGGGGGGNMNFAYIDPDNTHAFGTDMANGLLVPASYISKPGLTEGTFGLITVRALVGDGYGDIAPHVVFSEIAVSINDDILVTQGCIKTGTNGRASEARDAFNLVLIYYTQNNDFNLSWLNTAEILNLRHKTDYVVNVIGQIFDHNGEDYFNVNPQIV